MTQCIITGVLLINPDDNLAYNGDLFVQADTYIVNCNEQSGHSVGGILAPVKWIRPYSNHFWMRRGVYVFGVEDCQLSIAALEHIEK